MRRRVTLLLAGAGWGKSTALAAWARGRPVAWLTVDEDHQLAGRFVRDLLTTLRPFLRAPQPEWTAPAESPRAALLDALNAGLREDVVLVLDDAHQFAHESATAHLVDHLCDRAPGGLRIVLAARHEPAVRLHRLRGRGQLSDLDARALRMDEESVARFLSLAAGPCDPRLAGLMAGCTDGWPAALRLTVDALRDTPPDGWPGLLAKVHAGPQVLMRYVREEVLAKEPAENLALLSRWGRVESAGPGPLDDLRRRGLVLDGTGPIAEPRLLEPVRRCLAAEVPAPTRKDSRRVSFRTLGGFQVLRDGRAVPAAEWKSAKARQVLKLLLARRGAPVPREQLMDFLWPGEAPDRLGNRLSVVLSATRTALLGTRRCGGESPLVADRDAVQLDLLRTEVDVMRFLDQAAEALDADRRGGDSTRPLALAQQLYKGAFLADDLYAEWALPLREEAHSEYLCVLHALVRQAGRSGDSALAGRAALRLLEHDPYDEQAHIGLIESLTRAGRHGEARRRYDAYTRQMRTIGVVPVVVRSDPATAAPSP
ncbi:AfsR/SARP family transcriptional regulator [Kitasatospora sp. NPDC001175]|uniref:AfsR/SARP family transcriptional regulator n=1 Tax=Kitasatospora sp. NPDC001175 TaxID=3157103 RepID=UPI003D034CA1